MILEALRTQLELIHDITRRIEALEQQLGAYERSDERCRRLRAIPGVGPLTATAIVASVGDAREFRSGREFAAWLGLVRPHSSLGDLTPEEFAQRGLAREKDRVSFLTADSNPRRD